MAKNNFINNNTFTSLYTNPYTRYKQQDGVVDSPDNHQGSFNSINDINDFGIFALDADYSGSFSFDKFGSGLKNTQQLNIDYSQFVNHTFFDSAVSKVNVAFDKIINEFPFEGTVVQKSDFIETLTGFEKYVYDNFQKNIGYLNFKTNQYIEIKNSAGKIYPDFSSRKDGEAVLSPNQFPVTIETHVLLPEEANDNQVIFQISKDREMAMSLVVSASSSNNDAKLFFEIVSGSQTNFVSGTITKGEFNHVGAVYSTFNDPGVLKLYLNGTKEIFSTKKVLFENLEFNNNSGYIGSGSLYNATGSHDSDNIFTPAQTFSGSLDEFRYFHKERTQKEITEQRNFNISRQTGLEAYFRFNEPEGDYNLKSTILDYSGNSLHSLISNYADEMRLTGSIKSPVIFELPEDNPVLFIDTSHNTTLNINLLVSGTDYDSQNPNLITNLIPNHYLLEGQEFEGLSHVTGTMANVYKAQNLPGSGKIGSGQVLVSFLLLWAKFFDEVKLYIDSLSRVLHYGYEREDIISDRYLNFIGKYYGVNLPGIFSKNDILQFNKRLNISNVRELSDNSLNDIQNEIWRRILMNIRNLHKGKGTAHSIKGLIRTLGINPDGIFDIREYGNPRRSFLEGIRKFQKKSVKFLNFSGSSGLVSDPEDVNVQGFHNNRPYLVSAYLTSSYLTELSSNSDRQKEIFFPKPKSTATFQKFIKPEVEERIGTKNIFYSNLESDGLLTSGSFTYEATYLFDNEAQNLIGNNQQSLARLCVTGSTTAHDRILANLILAPKTGSIFDQNVDVKLYFNCPFTDIKRQVLFLSGVNMFNNKPWNISYGLIKSDDPKFFGSKRNLSSSLFLRCASEGVVHTTSSFYVDNENASINQFLRVKNSGNISGSFILIGSQSITTIASTDPVYCLNRTGVEDEARVTNFAGKINFLRFWSRGTSVDETRERSKYIGSYAIDEPLSNYNHVFLAESGSWNKLRLDYKISTQTTTGSSDGNFDIFDYSQNNFSSINLSPALDSDSRNFYYHGKARNFTQDDASIVPRILTFDMLTPKFDINQTDNKVRVRGYTQPENLQKYKYARQGRVFELMASEYAKDSSKFSLDLSTVKALDEDIMKLFSNLETFDQILGDPRALYESEYIGLENLRKVYFKDLKDKINLSSYFEFFTWFDEVFSDLLAQFIPIRTNFMGVNYVIESHTLERSRMRYMSDMSYSIDQKREEDSGINNIE